MNIPESWRGGFTLASSGALVSLAACASCLGAPSIQEITKAWRTRQDSASSFKVRWTERSVQEVSAAPESIGTPVSDSSGVKAEIVAESMLLFDGPRFRVDQRETGTLPDGNTYERSWTHSYNGRALTVFDSRLTGAHHPVASIRELGAFRSTFSYRPVLFQLRPLEIRFTEIDVSKLSLRHDTVGVDGITYTILERQEPGIPLKHCYWMTTTEGYYVTKYQVFHRSKLQNQVDIAVDHLPDGALAIRSWKTVRLGDDGVAWSTVEATVTSLELNVRAANSDFEVAFPSGTLINDSRRGQDLRYVVKDDMKYRRILPQEYNAPHRQLMATSPGELARSPARYAYALLCGLVLVMLAGAAVSVARWSRRMG